MLRKRVVSVCGSLSVMEALIRQIPCILLGSKKEMVSKLMPPMARTGMGHFATISSSAARPRGGRPGLHVDVKMWP